MVSNSDIFRCFQHIEDNIDACNLSEATRTFVLDNSEIWNYIKEKESFRKLIDKKQFEKAGKRLTEFHETSMATERRKKTRQSRTTGVATGLLNRIQQAWSRDFTGDTTTRFQDFLEKSESNFNSNKHYTKVIAVVQSSGAGKSRLMDELSKRSVGIVFTLRFGDQSGYPPGDIEVTKLLLNSVSRIVTAIESIEHTTCVALLSAAIEEISATFKEFKGKRFEFPLYFHDKMAAPPLAKPAETDPKNPVISAQGFSSIRSEFRKKFCERIVRKASVLVKAFEDDDDWKKIFQETPALDIEFDKMRSHPLVNQHLITPLRALVKRLDTDTTNVPIFFVFDEISTLLVDKNDPTTYLALRRVTRLFSELPVWTFVLSTQSQLYHLTPAAAEDRSSRVSLRQLQLCEPFHAFPLDIEADRLLGEGKARQMALPLARFSEKEHVVTFGRPLWMAYKDESCQNICRIVRDKLLFTSEDYDPNKLDHLLAVLSSRISLDPCLQSERAVQLEQTGVDSHLRLILGYNVKLGCFNSIWPSEPLVAAASASVLMDDNDRKDLWAKSIKRMANKLFSPGLIDKGRTGELATRLLLVVAHDKLLKNAPVSTDFSSSRFQYSQHFSFVGFMHSLLKNSDQLLDSKASVRKAKKTVRKIFGNGSMNFSFFTTTDQPLTESRDAMAELLHNLMFTQAALQLCSNQKTWDLLLPIYLGDPEDDFNSNLLTALMIQVKNRQRNQPYIINKANHATFFPVGTPVITIILELGVEQGGISPIGSFRDDVFGFKISGLGTEIYECLEKAMVKPLKSLLAVSTAAIQDDVSSRNMRFRHHTWSDRFPSLNIHRKDIGADSELGETTAGSSPKSDHKRKRTMTAGDRKKNQKAKV